MKKQDFPTAPAIFGVMLGLMLEENFVESTIKSDGAFAHFFAHPVAGVLGVLTIIVWSYPLLRIFWERLKSKGHSA
jgi:putative tricarboxylic transport membrane protein